MKPISLAYTPEEAKEETAESSEMEAPKYPYGLTLYFDDETMKKLGIDGAIDVGTMVGISGNAMVVGYSERATQTETRKCLDMQITDLAIEAPDTGLAQRMYGSK